MSTEADRARLLVTMQGRLVAHQIVLAQMLYVFARSRDESAETPRDWVRRTLRETMESVARRDHDFRGDPIAERAHGLIAEGLHGELLSLLECTLALLARDDKMPPR
jgi:hypothetical protein